MNVLLLFPMADGQTGPAIKYAFEQLGHKVVAVDAKLRSAYSFEAACNFSPDLVFCSRTPTLTNEVIRIKRKFKDTIACMWNVDSRYTVAEWKHLFPLIRAVDYHFVVEYNLLDEWRELNAKTYWLPQGLQDEVYDRPKEITEEDKKKYSCDVCFCGQTGGAHSDRPQYLEAIRQAGFKLNVWGGEGRPQIYNEEHNKQIALAKVNLCCSGWCRNERCTSVRNYKILGAGGFALELCRKEMHWMFPLNVLGCYGNPRELVEKIRYWLTHEEERKEIADRGYRWVRGNATYTHRMRMALDYMRDGLERFAKNG